MAWTLEELMKTVWARGVELQWNLDPSNCNVLNLSCCPFSQVWTYFNPDSWNTPQTAMSWTCRAVTLVKYEHTLTLIAGTPLKL